MSKLLLNLRDVPDDEADDVRRFLDSGAIGYYETRPSLWGTSGCIWIRDDGDVAEAKRLMAEYQRERQARARDRQQNGARGDSRRRFSPDCHRRHALDRRWQFRRSRRCTARDGTTHILLEPLDFLARLAALVPPPRIHLTRYHGVFAPHAALRAAITPAGRGQGAARDSEPISSTARPAGTHG